MLDAIRKEFHQCSRVIKSSKYERNDPATQLWWHMLFQNIEHDFKIPPNRREQALRDAIPDDLINKILAILSTDTVNNFGKKIENEKEKKSTDDDFPTTIYENTDISSVPSIEEEEEIEETVIQTEIPEEGEDIEAASRYSSDTNTTGNKSYNRDIAKIKNPYKSFMEKREDMVSIWRPKPPLLFEGMSLQQKTDVITETIAIDFIEWLKNIGGDETLTLDKKGVIDMFEIGFHMHAATSLCVQIREMPCVSKDIAKARHVPEASKRELLRKQLYRDMKAAKAKKKYLAFDRCLPHEMRVFPPKAEIATKWVHSTRVPEKIATMAGVWEGIEHLRSTRGYCKWLISHPSIPPPIYLKKAGMLDANFAERRYSLDSDTILPG